MNSITYFGRQLFNPIDLVLDRLTSYKLVQYFLYIYLGWGAIGAAFGKVGYQWYEILLSALWLIIVCRASNTLFARFFNIPKNSESDIITALILSLILTPAASLNEYLVLAAAGVVAMVSKYLLTYRRWHIFNPAAFGAFISGAIFHQYASWWVGTKFLTPVVIIGALLVLRKMKRFGLAIVFLVVALAIIGWSILLHQPAVAAWHNTWSVLIETQVIFFASVMLIEPLTSPRYARNYLPYGIFVAFVYGYNKLKISPEEALLLGNIFAYLIEPQARQKLTFLRRQMEAKGIQSYIFSGKQRLKYQAGQYMEWTVSERHADTRGNRRYLTLSSSPTEKEVMFTVKTPSQASSFKQKLAALKSGEGLLAAQVAGSFVLPKSQKKNLVFIAGGIGVTPFRSMIKYLLDFKQIRPITLIYAASSADEFAFRPLFKEAEKIGIKTTYVVTSSDDGSGWSGLKGPLDEHKLKSLVKNPSESTFYISGPYGFVRQLKNSLLQMGVAPAKIVSDYFPGYG